MIYPVTAYEHLSEFLDSDRTLRSDTLDRLVLVLGAKLVA